MTHLDPILFDRPPTPIGDDIDVIIAADDGAGAVTVDPATGAVSVEHADGTVTVDLEPEASGAAADDDHDANLAYKIDEQELSRIAEDLLRGYDADEQSRAEWLETRAEGIRLLGLRLAQPGRAADGTADVAGVSKVDHPLLLEAVLRFQANARGELLPAAGPVKVRDDAVEEKKAAGIGHNGGPPLDEETRDELAEALEKDLNHYLTVTAKEYYPDTDRMLLYVGLGGAGIKKIYTCPLRRRPVSESVDVKDLIVANAATDLLNAGRITHRIMMRPATLRRMQLVGAYRDIDLNAQPAPTPNAADRQIAETQGVAAIPQQPEDQDHTILEIYCELDIKGHEHKDDHGEETGLPIPYVVVIDKDSRNVLAVRRNYDREDDLCLPRLPFVKYSFVPGLGFYDLGLVHLLGNTTKALTAAWRLGLDAGMFANFPGFLFLAAAMRQKTNVFNVPPGSGAPIESNVSDIRQAIMPLPYKEMGPAMSALIENIAQTGQRVGGTAEVMVGEGRQDAPVGTTIAMIEQATMVLDAVHKRLHTAQSEEFQLLRDELRKAPSVLYRHRKSRLAKLLGAGKSADDAQRTKADEQISKALDDYELVPVADPNTPSHMQRVMRAVAIKQMQMANPQLYDARKVDRAIMRMIGVTNPDELFAPPPPPSAAPGPSPDKALEMQMKGEELKQKAAIEAAKIMDNAKERAQEEKLAVLDLAKTLAIHPESEPLVQRTVEQSNRRVI